MLQFQEQLVQPELSNKPFGPDTNVHRNAAVHLNPEEGGQGGVRKDSKGLGLQDKGEVKARGVHGKVRGEGGPDEELHLHVGEHRGHLGYESSKEVGCQAEQRFLWNHAVVDGQIQDSSLLVHQPGRVEEVFGDAQIHHAVVVGRKGQCRRGKGRGAGVVQAEKLPLQQPIQVLSRGFWRCHQGVIDANHSVHFGCHWQGLEIRLQLGGHGIGQHLTDLALHGFSERRFDISVEELDQPLQAAAGRAYVDPVDVASAAGAGDGGVARGGVITQPQTSQNGDALHTQVKVATGFDEILLGLPFSTDLDTGIFDGEIKALVR